ncbi:MAG: hypothetical protein KDC54_25165, partial [Lewinella sp.]|nr:hypothetical protein [Lewinella sp.]
MNKDTFSRIEAYLTGELPPDDRQAFEEEVARDEALARELEQHRLEHQAMRMLLHDELRATMQSWRKDAPSTKAEDDGAKVVSLSARRGRVRRLLSIAASLLLLIGFGGSWWAHQTVGNQALAQSYAEGLSTSQRGGAAREAESLLKAGDTQAAIDLLQDATDVSDRLLLAQAYFQQKDYAAASAIYAEIEGLPTISKAQRDLAQWQNALAQLGQGDATTARELLQGIAQSSGNDYQDDAAGLLRKLDSGWRRIAW